MLESALGARDVSCTVFKSDLLCHSWLRPPGEDTTRKKRPLKSVKILRNCPPSPPLNQSSHKFLVTWLQTLSPFVACLPPSAPPPLSRTPYSLSNISKNLIELVQNTRLAIRIGKDNSTFKYQTFCTYICLQLIRVINALLQLYLLTSIYKYAVTGSIHMTLSMDLSFSCEYFRAKVTTDTCY